MAFLRNLPAESTDLVFLDPPFNLGKDYGLHRSIDKRPVEEYSDYMKSVLSAAITTLKPGAALYFYHIPLWAMRLGSYLEGLLDFRHWISVSMKNGFARGNRLYPAHYALLYFTKGSPSIFNRPKLLPARCRACGEKIKDYGGYSAIIEEKGINLSDVWDDLSPVRHGNRKFRTANELPPKLTERVVSISGILGGLFVDPFAGSGTAIMSAVSAGMNFKACDLVAANCTLIQERLTSKK